MVEKQQKKARLIRAFVVDDERLQLEWDCEIEICRPPGSGETKESSVSGWVPHLQDLYRHKEIAFDLLSIDVFFTQDLSDPVHRLPREKGEPAPTNNLSSGLVHGLAAMARRQHSFEGNVMPLAFEVRTVSPNKDGMNTEEWADVTRTYGLLLALMTPFDSAAGFLGLGKQANPALAVRNAFKDQPARPGAAIDLPMLLEEWRERFVAGVASGQVSVDSTNLKLLEALEPSTILSRPDAYVEIIGRRGQICDRILLRSIFSDLVQGRTADYRPIMRWISTLVQIVDNLVGFADDTARWAEFLAAQQGVTRATAKQGAISSSEAADYWDKMSGARQSLAMIAYQTAAILADNKFPPFKSQTALAAAIGVENFNENKIKRMFQKAADHVHVTTATEVRDQFLGRLADPTLKAPFSPMFLRALGRSLAKLGLVDIMRMRSPILVEVLDETDLA